MDVRDTLLEAPRDLLAHGLGQLHLPVRCESRLKAMGIARVGDLSKYSDEDFLAVEGFGRGSLNDLRKGILDAIENFSLFGVEQFDRERSTIERVSFSQLLLLCPERVLCAPIAELRLAVRPHKRLSGLGVRTVGDLRGFTPHDLLELQGFGLRSLRDLEAALHDLLVRFQVAPFRTSALESAVVEQESPFCLQKGLFEAPASTPPVETEVEADLNHAFQSYLHMLNERTRRIILGRMGLESESLTLEQMGEEIGITRERVRQVQKKAVAWLRDRTRIHGLLSEALVGLLNGRREPLYIAAFPVEHRFFRHLKQPVPIVSFLIEHLLSEDFSTFMLHGQKIVARISESEWDQRKSASRAFIATSTSSRLPETTARLAIDAIAGEQAMELADELWRYVSAYAHFATPLGAEAERVLVAYGRGVEQMVTRVLEDSPVPLHYSAIARIINERYGEQDVRRVHNAAAEVGELLDRGVYGTFGHVGLTASESQYVASMCESIIGEAKDDRQWHSRDFIEILAGSEPLFEKLSPYYLSAVLKKHSSLHYVGRQVWTGEGFGGSGGQFRLDIRNVIEAVLEEEGGPLNTLEIYKRVRAIRGVGDHFQIHPRGRLIRFGPSTWGLSDRDALYPEAETESALAGLEMLLETRKKALHVSEISEALGEPWRSHNPWHLFGRAQVDTRFRTFPGEYLCLSGWESTSRPTIAEALRSIESQLRSGLSLEQVREVLEVAIERPLVNENIRSGLRSIGAYYRRPEGLWCLDSMAETEDLEA